MTVPRRRLLIASCLVIMLVVITLTANLVLTRYVKESVVKALRCATGDSRIAPTVTLGDTPMLVELASRKLDQVTISGLSTTSVEKLASGPAAAVPDGELSVTLRGLGLGDPTTVTSARASVRLGWSALGPIASTRDSRTEGATLGEEDGELAVTLKNKVAGQTVTVLVGLEPDGRSLIVTPESVVVGGREIGLGLVSLLTGDLLRDENGRSRLDPQTIDLDLPDGVTLDSVGVESDGLALSLDVDPSVVRDNAATARAC